LRNDVQFLTTVVSNNIRRNLLLINCLKKMEG